MAVHVVQGRDPWWGPLAVNILGGLFNDWQQRERNKKENAAAAEAIKQIYARPETQNDTLTPAPVQDTGQELLNTDGWAGAFHKNENPLAQFDLDTAEIAPTIGSNTATVLPTNAWANTLGNSGNTAGIVPPTAQTPAAVTAQPVQGNRIPTTLDIYNVLWPLLGTKRFGMVNSERMQSILTPYFKANEEARQEQLRNNLADDYMNATDGAGRIKTVTGGALRGIVPESMANTVFNQNKPTISTVDTGGQILFNNIDPMTGMPINTWAVDRTLTPQQQLDHQFRMLQHEAQQAQLREQMNYNYASLKQQGDLERARLDAENNSVSQIFTGNDGYQYVITKGGSQRKATDVPGLTAVQRSIIEINQGRIKEIHSQREQLQKSRNTYVNKGQSDSPDVAEIDRQLSELDKQEKEYQNKIYGILQSVSTGQQGQQTADNNTKLVGTGMDIGANMLNIKKPTITTEFGTPRKKADGTSYNHAGTDYAMKKDSPIRMADIGTTMRVTKVANQPGGYGNYVVAEGKLTGADGKEHTISMLWAHMGDGTTNVRKGQEIRHGDLIGKVGNTGNSRGENGGYHLHLETRIDGKLVNPRTFNEQITPYIAHSRTNTSNTFTGVTLPPQATVAGRAKQRTIVYRNPKTGKEINQLKLEKLEEEAEDRLLSYAKNKEELHKYLQESGYVRVENNNTQNTQEQTQTTSGDIAQNQQTTSGDVTNRNVTQNTAHDPENETAGERALNALNGQFNTWDEIYRNRYPFSSMSDFRSV